MQPSVCVLMCTYNGERFIREQLDSLNAQNGVRVSVLAHDDGSTDTTTGILDEYNIPRLDGEHLGPARGFLYLLQKAGEADFYAFCDQDDIWDEDKLFLAADSLKDAAGSENRPALYCCSTRLVKEDGSYIMDHRIDSQRTLASRLFYASISGNTVVINSSMRELALKALPDRLIMHDSWLVKLCIAAGGTLIIDEKPHMNYRMHSSNQVGIEMSLKDKIRKFKTVAGNDGAGQELYDICRMYGDCVLTEYRELSAISEEARSSSAARRRLLKEGNIDFKNRGFNLAFRCKVMRGNL